MRNGQSGDCLEMLPLPPAGGCSSHWSFGVTEALLLDRGFVMKLKSH